MPGVSIHVVDVSRGVVAAGMLVELYHCGSDGAATLVCRGAISPKGLLEDPVIAGVMRQGFYEARFYIKDYYEAQRVGLPALPFLDVVSYRFGIADEAQHYHLPMKCTPWGYSCFRGGA